MGGMPGQGTIPVLARAVNLGLILSFILMTSGPSAILAQPADAPDDVTIYDWFEEVSSLRSQGRYDEAIGVLETLISGYSVSEEVARRAYNDLVFTLLSKRDEAAVAASAKEALTRFPDLAADPVYFPPSVNQAYDRLRDEMFGGLNVATKPDSCRIFLGDEFVGFSPLNLEYVPVGEYILNVTRPGYNDESTPIRIEPSYQTSVPLSLQKERGRGWWLMRIGPAALLTGVLVATRLGGDEPAGAEPLPGPPPPPGQ
ncbi:MAG: PEGA domain-containing protein [Candidatus Eisenbacteria bacterium]